MKKTQDSLQISTQHKHRAAIDEYFINGFLPGEAYLKVYTSSKSNVRVAGIMFGKILLKGSNRAYLREKYKDARLIAQVSHESLLNELRNWAYGDITPLLTMSVKQIQKLPPETRRLINAYETNTYDTLDKHGKVIATRTVVKVKLVDKVKAMEMIHRHTGFNAEDNYQKRAVILTPKDKAHRLAELREKALKAPQYSNADVQDVSFEEVGEEKQEPLKTKGRPLEKTKSAKEKARRGMREEDPLF